MISLRQKQIIEKAIQLIAEQGIQSLTIKNLAHSLFLSEPALYRHFKNKRDILCTLITHYQNEIDRQISRIPPQSNILKTIELQFLTGLNYFHSQPALVSIAYSEEAFHYDPIIRQKLAEVSQARHSDLTELIVQGQRDRLIRDDVPADHLATLILGTMRFIYTDWKLRDYSFNLIKKGKSALHHTLTLIRRESLPNL